MLCKGCGFEISSNQQFCTNCGVKNDLVGGPPNQMPPNQMPLNQMPPNQMPPNQMPPYQMPPNMMPSPPPYIPNAGKKSNKAILPIILVSGVALILIIGIFVTSKVRNVLDTFNNQDLSEAMDAYAEDTDLDTIYEDTTVEDYVTEDTADVDVFEEEDDIVYDEGEITDSVVEDFAYDFVYSYTELPEVVSIDADKRFTYYDYYLGDELSTYTFQFYDPAASEEDFYNVVNGYCGSLQDYDGFYYEQEFTDQQYTETGVLTNYLSKDNICIGISTGIEESNYYAYITIFSLTEETQSNTVDNSLNSDFYILGRDSKYFDLGTEVLMDNGIAFFLNDVLVTDMGDGTATLDANFDLGAYLPDCNIYSDDFMIVPMDSEGNILSDACMAAYVSDSDGYSVTMPFLLSTEAYYKYTISFIVPANTTAFTVYGTNLLNEEYAGPVYYLDMEVDEY